MSLLGQSQQFFPTSVQVTVHQARNLRVKGKNGSNDSYAIIQLAKDKFSTSVAEKSVAPVWKEEASFDLPLFHPGNAERCTLYIVVMHRAQVGLDKFLGQAMINLLELHDDKSRKKTQWFKLVDKNGKEDKVRGEVLLDIQFMRNNMSASMFDLSMQDKPRSRISKLKDKVRGKKKDGFSDSASAIVPPVSQVLTDSEEDADAQSLNHSPGAKKKSKLKTLFAPKSNLQRNLSQSMSTLGTLPEKNSSLSGSRSSGLNVDSPEGKKKFKLLGHKRTGSSDSKMSLGPFSILGRSKQNVNDQNNLCINGNHVYAEEPETKSGSTLSLNSSGKGSVEDIRKYTSDIPAESSKTINVPSFKPEPINKVSLEQQRHQEEEERRQAEEKRLAEVKRLEQEEKYRAEAKRLQEEEQRKQQEEQDRRRRVIEDEARKKKQKEEEDRRREDERNALEAAENQRLEDERRRAEERKRQEEASMSDRLSSLFGMIRKKEEKKEDVPQQAPEEQKHTLAPHTNLAAPVHLVSHHSTNPFEETSSSSGPSAVSTENSGNNHKFNSNPQAPSATIFLGRNAKVSAVKPRLSQSLESETSDCQTPGQLDPISVSSESTFNRVPAESSEAFSNLHLLLAPPNRSPSWTGSPWGSTEDLSSVELGRSSSAMADQKRKALLPPSYSGRRTPTEDSRTPVRDVKSPAFVEEDEPPRGNKLSLPLPDYESLFPQRRHGVQGQTRWDHIIAEVNQKHRDSGPELMGPEMSVDGPEEGAPSLKYRTPQENPAEKMSKTRPVSVKKVHAPGPPKQATSSLDFNQYHRQNVAPQSVSRPNPSAVPPLRKTDSPSNRMFREGVSKEAKASTEAAASHRPPQTQKSFDPAPADGRRTVQVPLDKDPPTAKPRQRLGTKEPTQQEQTAVSSNIQALVTENKTTKNIAELNQLPYTQHKSIDGPGPLKMNPEDEGLFIGRQEQPEQKSEDVMMRKDYLKDFSIENPADRIDVNDHNFESDSRNIEEQISESISFQRKNSQRTKKNLPVKSPTDDKPFMSQQESASNEMTNLPSARKDFPAGDVIDGSAIPKSQYDARTQSSYYAEKDQYESEVFRGQSALAYSEPLPVVPEEPESQTGNLWGGKTPLRAWVSPSEAQPVSTQYSNGSGLALTPRRPHPVKPMSSAEIQQPTITPAVKEIKVQSSVPAIMKVADSVSSGPYSQLTQEELITLVVKQQADLSRKDAKISELEQYIDNLLVRVMEEKPAILYTLNSAKQA